MVFDHRDESVDVTLVEAEAWRDLTHHRHPDLGVVTGVSLADVVQQRSDDEEVGP